MAAFPAKGVIADSKACLDFGPSDRSARALLANSQVERKLDALPRGVAQQIVPTGDSVGIIMNTHWINSSDKPKNALVKIKIKPAKRGSVRRYLKPIFEVVANGFIDVAPGEVEDRQLVLGPRPAEPRRQHPRRRHGARGAGVRVLDHLAHTQARVSPSTSTSCARTARGRRFSRRSTTPIRPRSTTPASAECRSRSSCRSGDRLEYTLHARQRGDYAGPPRLRGGAGEGPWEERAVGRIRGWTAAPTAPRSAARRRGRARASAPRRDPAYPGRTFTGNCVPANLVFGFTSEDDMCILPGAYFEPNLDAPGNECDVKLLR